MLNIEDYKLIFASVGLIGVLLFASPTLGFLLHLPGGERFSELWILGPSHMIEGYPSKVKVGESYLGLCWCWKPLGINGLLRHLRQV